MIFVWLAIFAIFIFTDVIPLYKERDKRVFLVYTVILAAAFVMAILFSFGIKLPSSAKLIKSIVSYFIGIS